MRPCLLVAHLYRTVKQQEVRDWVLREWSDPESGRALLLDEESQLVYVWDKVRVWL